MPHGSEYYLYGVILADGQWSFGPIGIGGRGDEVRAVVYRDIAAVASPCPPISFQTNDPQQTLQRLAEHQAVLERVMAASTVLPVKFGTWVCDKAEVEGILRGGYCNLRAALDRFEGRIELDVVATWPELAVVLGQIAAEPEICNLKAELQQGGAVSAEQCIQLGQLVKSRLDARREKLSAEILAELGPASTASPRPRSTGWRPPDWTPPAKRSNCPRRPALPKSRKRTAGSCARRTRTIIPTTPRPTGASRRSRRPIECWNNTASMRRTG